MMTTKTTTKTIKKVMLTQPNFSWFGKRTWKLLPYSLGLLNASLKNAGYDSWIFDPNFNDLSTYNVRKELRRTKPDAIGITTFSSEYIQEPMLLSNIIKEELPNSIVILGGILPTVLLSKAIEDPNVDFFMIAEGEYRLPMLLDYLNKNDIDSINDIDGLSYLSYVEYENNENRLIHINPMKDFIQNLDDVHFPYYGNLDLSGYTNYTNKYILGIIPRQFPFATTMSSRGCPYRCVFCASATVSGRKVRLRSAENVLKEIDELHDKYRIKEIIFQDDHFLFDRQRSIDIMNGIIDRNENNDENNENNSKNYGLTWKCVNINVKHLDRDILELMKKSGCYQITISVESGNPYVLKNIIKKPLDLDKIPIIMNIAKELGFEICANFVIGFPGETWEQIRDTFRYAEKLNVDYVAFHIATPLPKTELMEICKKKGYLQLDDTEGKKMHCYTKGVIQTPDFTPMELQILRAFEWDRINFSNLSNPDRKETIARMQGITLDELEEWRINTRRNIGITI